MDEISLIENVRNHECLFNLKSRHYRNQHIRQEAWEEIAKDINSTVSSVRSTWTKLRNAFINAKKRREAKSGQGTTKVVPWKYEQEMSFLLPYLECRQTQSNLESQQDESNIINDESTADEDTFNDTPKESMTADDENLTQPELLQSTNTPVVSAPVVSQSSQKKARLSSKQPSPNPALELVRIMKQNVEARNERRNKASLDSTFTPHLDEIDMFYLSMAKTVKRLPPRDQAYIRMELCRMVSQAEIRNLEVQYSSDRDNGSTSSATSLHSTPLLSPTDPSLSTQFNCPPPATFSTCYSTPQNENDIGFPSFI